MPLPKPHKGESQDDFMARCMHEAYGSDAPSDRTQEQAVAMCFDAWRSKDKTIKQSLADLNPDDCPDPEEGEDKDDYIERCVDDLADQFDLSGDDVDEHYDDLAHACETNYETFSTQEYEEEGHKPSKVKAKQIDPSDLEEPEEDEGWAEFMQDCIDTYTADHPDVDEDEISEACDAVWDNAYPSSNTEESLKPPKAKRKRAIEVARIIANWKSKFGKDPSEAIRKAVGDAPDPEGSEAKDEFMDRCMDFLEENTPGLSDTDAEDVCEEQWNTFEPDPEDKSNKHKRRKMGTKQSINTDDLAEPGEDESMDDFVSRCVAEYTAEHPDADEDDVDEACQEAWESSGIEESHKPSRFKQRPGVAHFKTHSEEVQGMEFVLSDETPDRMGDIITATGWEFEQFNKNPIALFNHNANFPIGRWQNLRVDGTALKGHLIMAPKGTSDRIDEIRKLIDVGILKAVSVGFRDIESEPLDKKDPWSGRRFTKAELVETSLVSVPANPNALAVAKSLNISATTIDLVFAKHGNRDRIKRRGGPTGKHAQTSQRNGRGAMTPLAERIATVQTLLNESKDKLNEHWGKTDQTNISDADMQVATDLNSTIAQLEKQHAALIESERLLGKTADNGSGTAKVRKGRAITVFTPQPEKDKVTSPAIVHVGKELDPIDYLVRAGTVAHFAKQWNKSPDEVRLKIYGDDDGTRASCEMVLRAASAPAITTVTGWAAELVQQTYAALMPLLMPQAILTRLSARGLALSFGTAGRIIIPTRSRTPTLAGSFVGEGLAIPVRQGAFTTQTLVPKKMAVISTWTREMGDHSVPAIEGLIREAIQQDTSVAVDTVLIDSNAATAIRPAGLLNGVAATTATAGGGLTALIGDIAALVGAVTTSTYGNLRNPTWLMNPTDLLRASLTMAANTGIFPFRDEIKGGTLNTIPVVDSATVPAKTMILVDAGDFVVVGGEAPRMEMSDQATLHMEDTSPAELVASPSTVAAPQRSLFQTDSLALRMVLPLNWVQRRAGTIAWTQNVTW